MRTVALWLCLAIACSRVTADDPADEDVVLPALSDDTSLPARLLIFIPGGLVPNVHYKLMLQAIQKATTGVRLTVVMPAVFNRLCIITCPSSGTCVVLKKAIDGVIEKSGFKSTNAKEDTFVAGHSLGATCANYLVQGYNYEFAGLMEFGGYVDMEGDGSLANFSIPVLHTAGELDGGLAKPGKLSFYYGQSRDFEKTHTTEETQQKKPVHILEGLDHSDFCPGFFVTKVKDCKSEVTQDVALERIGKVTSSFLHLNNPVSSALKSAAMETMKGLLPFTKEMCDPYLEAFSQEGAGQQSPWCTTAQHTIAGLSAADSKNLAVNSEGHDGCYLVPGDLHQFEHFHTTYAVSNGVLSVACGGSVDPPSNLLNTGGSASAASIDCKMVDATRVAEQLKVSTNASVECGDVNKLIVEAAEKLLPEKSRKRYEEKGRKYCFKPDDGTFGNIGPLFIKGSLKQEETKDCMEVTALKLISTVDSKIFPGNHYCKMLSPGLVLDWMMTDSHKPFPYNLEAKEAASYTYFFHFSNSEICEQIAAADEYAALMAQSAFSQGSCKDQGFTVKVGQTQTVHDGDLIVDTFKKASSNTVETVVV